MTEDQMEWLSLDKGEQLVWQGQPRIKSILPAVLIGIPTAILGIGILIIAGAYLSVKNTKYVVSSEGLYVKKGVLSRSVQKIGFEKVQNISFSQGILGNYFGYGNIEISTAGGSGVEMRFRSIRNPKQIQQKINNRIKSTGTREESASSGRGQEELLEEILSELKEMNSKI
ncbi:PH domain-containing protein [Nanohaloarchaea archaeon H01]|nr:PH domain-containing protein [Nanohaloarchaea archaeon H01]